MLLPVVLLFSIWATATAKRTQYTNRWMANIHGGEEVAQRVARDMGFTYKGQVKWAEQQLLVEQSKRGLVSEYHERELSSEDAWNKLFAFASQYSSSSSYRPDNKIKDDPADPTEVGKANFDSIPKNTFSTKPAEDSQLETYTGPTLHIRSNNRESSPYEAVFNDPMWGRQWYEQDYRTTNVPVMDHNVVPVYRMGYTGKDVTIMVVDEGIDHDHRDLVGNFDPALSYDYCDNIAGCRPDKGKTDSTGTQAAGIIAMVANNHKCGVGIAYNAKVAGAKVLCSKNSQVEVPEAKGLVHEVEKVDIYSCAWGPADDGKTMVKMPRLIAEAIDKGISEGRNNKGAIYVFSSGNGNHFQDNCGADPFSNHNSTIVIASANQLGKAAYYSEHCTAVFATTYSGDSNYYESLVSTVADGACTKGGTGTSASVALASGIIALALDAKSDLTYRDVMHLIAWSSEVAPLANNENTWNKNGRGLWVSRDFGFGLLNAENMVNLAKNWKRVPKLITCKETIKIIPSQFYDVEGLRLFHDAKACQDQGDNGVRYLEHIELTTTVDYYYRGAIRILIKSPEGTKTTLLEVRANDKDANGLQSWKIKSVHNWGENPKGQWIIEVQLADAGTQGKYLASARDFSITFHGTHEQPNHYNHPRTYTAFRLPDGRTSHVSS